MSDGKTLIEVLDGVQGSIEGLRLEVGGLRTHMGSTSHFLIMAVEDLQKLIEQLRRQVQP